MHKAGHWFARSSLSRGGEGLGQRYRKWAVAEGWTKCPGTWGQTVNSVGGGRERWEGSMRGVIIQRKFLDYSVIMWIFGYVVIPVYKNEDVFIFCLLLNWVLSYFRACAEGRVTCVQYLPCLQHSLFEVKSNLVLQTWNSGFLRGNGDFRYVSSECNKECQ